MKARRRLTTASSLPGCRPRTHRRLASAVACALTLLLAILVIAPQAEAKSAAHHGKAKRVSAQKKKAKKKAEQKAKRKKAERLARRNGRKRSSKQTTRTTTQASATSSSGTVVPSATDPAPPAPADPAPVAAAPVAAAFTPGPAPMGAPGAWTLVFSDDFNGTALDTSRWIALDGYKTNNVTTSSQNVSVSGGTLNLKLASSKSGAEVSSAPYAGAGANGYTLPVGGFTEARIMFPGPASGTSLYNWPAWWASGPSWPAAGEHDILEGGTEITVNYHSPSGAHNQGVVPGAWGNAFHTYGLYRGPGFANVYYDGALVKTYATDDNGQPQSLLINVGSGGGAAVYGDASTVKVDYVRAWAPR